MAETQYQQHAKELAKTMDLFGYDGIICISGDGILLEVFLCFNESFRIKDTYNFHSLKLV